jgi:homoserine O-acetyltransferase
MKQLVVLAIFILASLSAAAADYPTPQEADWIAPEFTFHTGEKLADFRQHYITIGAPSNPPVLILHGTAGSAASMLTAAFAGQLFGPGQPLDATHYFIILPDAIGAGGSAKPSDGLHAKFPRYNYADMVLAQYRLVTEGLGIHHLRLVMGNSMGGMHVWVWGEAYPDFMDALVPMASQPTAMASRNWMMRRMVIDAVRSDPAWQGGDYTSPPPLLKWANVFFGIATSGGTLGYQAIAPTHELADKLVDNRLAAPFTADANDTLYQWDASRDFNAAPALARIEAAVLAINSADDERNPPETGLEEQALTQVKNARLYLIPASAETRGHGTTGFAKFYTRPLEDFLQSVPHHQT